MKRSICILLSAVFLSVLCIPCAAADTSRGYPGFSDVSEDSVSYEAIKLCYERGLMNGTSETTFNPQGKLNIAQLVVLAARLYDLQNGGDGTIPEPPDLSQSFARYYDGDGNVFLSYTIEDVLPTLPGYNRIAEEEDADIPETCTLEVGYEGYNHIRIYQGVRESHGVRPTGFMTQGYYGTGYYFPAEDENDWNETMVHFASPDLIAKTKDAWWFPAAFYLGSEGKMGWDGTLIFRASGGDISDDYDPLTRFSSDNATRSLFAWLVDLTAGELPVINENAALPADVNPELAVENAGSVLRLYQAGILTGVDKAGNFNGYGELTRAQAAIMLARVLEPSLRVKMD